MFSAGFGAFKVWQARKEIIKLSNALAVSEGTLKETETAVSVKAQQISDLEAQSKDLQKKINDRDENVAALASATLKLKNQLFKITNAKVTIIDGTDQSTCPIPSLRIEFEKEQDPWLIQGYCWTNSSDVSGGAEVSVSWTRPLQFSFVMTKNTDQYRLYLDNNSPDVIAIESLSLRIDPSVYARRWYQKIAVGLDLGVSGTDPLMLGRVTYDIGRFALGPFIAFSNDSDGLQKIYGVSLGWRPF